MFNKKDFELIPYINNVKKSKVENSLNKELIASVKDTIIKIVNYSDALLMQGVIISKILLGEMLILFISQKIKY